MPLNSSLTSGLMESLYNEITKFTYYPTPTQYRDIIDSLLYKYPYLRESKDVYIDEDSIVRKWKNMLSDKFRNTRKRRDSDLSIVIAQKKKYKPTKKTEANVPDQPNNLNKRSNIWGLDNFMPERPETEDDSSIRIAIEWMTSECAKKKQDIHGITKRMDLTFADRRQMIVNQITPINQLKEIFPVLFEEDGILTEFTRLTGFEIDERLLASLKSYGAKLIKLSPKADEILDKIQHQKEDDKNRFAGYQAILSVPDLFKEDLGKIVCHLETKPDKVSTPLIIANSTILEESSEFEVVADDIIIAKCSELILAIEILFSTYYVFNIQYSKKSYNTLTFIQRILLNINDGAVLPRKVLSLVTKLKQ